MMSESSKRHSKFLSLIFILKYLPNQMDKKNAFSISFSESFAKRRAICLSVRKTVNIQGYSKLREPIKARENCYPLIWYNRATDAGDRPQKKESKTKTNK